MREPRHELLTAKNILITAAGVGLFCFVAKRYRILDRLRLGRDLRVLKQQQVEVVETVEHAHDIVQKLQSHCSNYKVLGFDCEWITVSGKRRPVAMLQLCSNQGLCALFRLCTMGRMPKSLRELLENDDILKVGIAPVDDAKKLSYDYGVGVQSTLDLRFLAAFAGVKPSGLANLSARLLNVELDKSWRISCSNWESKFLQKDQLTYAANDALVSMEIFNKLMDKLYPVPFFRLREEMEFWPIQKFFEPYLDLRYKESYSRNFISMKTDVAIKVEPKLQMRKIRKFPTRSRVLYDNCFLLSPDGNMLCTIDRRKAEWYVKQGLGVTVKPDPLTVRLTFKPAGGPVGEAGQYYLTPKDNRCVVCGTSDAYLRKHIVPKEYRKFFPDLMKTHNSHDVLLLCPECHQKSNMYDLQLRKQLADLCDAPITYADGAPRKETEITELKQVKSAACALLNNGENIPKERYDSLAEVILKHYPEEKEITDELLQKAANLKINVPNEDYSPHGAIVVDKFKTVFGGLVNLEKMWRSHFLKTMIPQYMPPLWRVDHNEMRMKTRTDDGRVKAKDLIDAGIMGPTAEEKPPAEGTTVSQVEDNTDELEKKQEQGVKR